VPDAFCNHPKILLSAPFRAENRATEFKLTLNTAISAHVLALRRGVLRACFAPLCCQQRFFKA
jgi:hypothetical protein